MLSALPPEQHVEVVAAYRVQAMGFVCSCGLPKSASCAVCEGCRHLLDRAGLSYFIFSLAWYAHNNVEHFASRCRQQYEAIIEVAQAMRTGRWDGKRSKRSQEE